MRIRTTTFQRTLWPTLLGVLIALLLIPGRAAAQADSPADLRRENDALRNRVAQLEAANSKLGEDVDRLQKRVSQLESQVSRLQSENTKLRNQKTDAPATPPATSPADEQPKANLPADPLACPASLFQALKKSYTDEFGSRTVNDEDRSAYIKDVRRWAGQMKREFRDRVTWTVEIQPADVPGDERLPTKLRVVDPDTHEAYHNDPVAIDLGYRNTRRIIGEPNQKYWVIEGVFFADPDVNADREEAGALNYPAFIGPFAEFKFGLSVMNIAPDQ